MEEVCCPAKRRAISRPVTCARILIKKREERECMHRAYKCNVRGRRDGRTSSSVMREPSLYSMSMNTCFVDGIESVFGREGGSDKSAGMGEADIRERMCECMCWGWAKPSIHSITPCRSLTYTHAYLQDVGALLARRPGGAAGSDHL